MRRTGMKRTGMKRKKGSSIVLIPLLLLVASGCASKSELESLRAELTLCQEEKAHAEAQVISWEQRFDRESQRWESMGASISEQLPQALNELHAERARIVELVPDHVQAEVELYFDEYFSTVNRGFDKLLADNREIKTQLTATRQALDDVGADISSSIDSTLAQERGRLEEERARRQQEQEAVASRLAEVVELVAKFDNTRINCKQCPDRLKLNRKERETISAFHSQLTSRLSQVQSAAQAPDAP